MTTIRTNNNWREFKTVYDVPTGVYNSQFDHHNIDTDADRYFKYRGYWYHLDMFVRCDGNFPFKGWDGYHADSYFSGVVIKLSPDGERYIIGTYTS